jgi:hypothetical protein
MFAVILASPSTAPFAQTAPLCDRLDQAMAATTGADVPAETVGGFLTGLGMSPASCSFSLDTQGAKSANCNWAFSYRSAEATGAFKDMLAELSACADMASGIETDQSVNHPDFYDLRLMRIAGGDVGLSIKDKAAIQQTYVFLRLTPAKPK